MDVLDLMVVDKVSDLIITEDENYNIASLSNSAFRVLTPKNIEVGDKVIHIRPSVVITNPNVKIPQEYWSDELQAYLSPTREFKNRRVSGIVISIDDLNYNDDFKNLLNVNNPVFPENPLSDYESLDYFNKYGICNLEDYLYFRIHSLVKYKPSRLKFLNPFTIEDVTLKGSSNSGQLEAFKNDLNSIEESDLDKYTIVVTEDLNALYSGFVYIINDDTIYFNCKERRLSFVYSKIDKTIRKYSKFIEKAKKINPDAMYTDEIILELMKNSKTLIPKLLNKLNEACGVLIVGCQTIGKKVLNNYYDSEFDFHFFIDNLMTMEATTGSVRILNVDTYVKEDKNYTPLKPLKIITDKEQVKLITDKINEGDLKYFESEFLNKYLRTDDSKVPPAYSMLKKNPEALVINCYNLKEQFNWEWHTFTLDNAKYKKYLNIK